MTSIRIDVKEASCQSLCEEQQEESREEWVELSLSVHHSVWQSHDFWPQERAHCPSNFADGIGKNLTGVRHFRVTQVACAEVHTPGLAPTCDMS